MKIVINACFGGFSLSDEAVAHYAALKGLSSADLYSGRDIPRDDPALVQVVETLGERANGFCARLRIVEIPSDVKWHLEEYDGNEHIAEDHRTWH